MPELMRMMRSGPCGGSYKMFICWNVIKSMGYLEHHIQLLFDKFGLPLKM